MVGESQNPLFRLRNFFSLALFDQLITSGSNAALSLIAAKALDADQFGIFAVVVTAYFLGNGTIRALYGEPLLVGWSKATQHEEETPAQKTDLRLLEHRVAHISLLMVFALVPATIVLFFSTAIGLGLLLALPGLYLQTIVRWTLYARNEYGRAVTMNALWAVIMLGVPLLLLLASVDLVAWHFAAIWGLSGFALAAWALSGRRVNPNAVLSLSARKLRASWAAGRQYWVLYLLTSGTTQLCLLALALSLGTEEIGAVRGALLLFSPVGTLFGGLSVRSIQLLARSVWTKGRLKRALPMLMAPPVVLVTVWIGVVALALVIDPNLLGDTTDKAVGLLPWACAMQMAQALLQGPTWVLKGLGQLERLNRWRGLSALCAIAGTVFAITTERPFLILVGVAVGFVLAALAAPVIAVRSVPRASAER